jgi:hypothetical protein
VGANSKQGWCLFVFLIGFAFLPAGLAYLGPLFTLVGLACLVASLIGFYRIKQLEHRPHALAPAVAARTKHAM